MRVALLGDVHTNLVAWDALVRHWHTQQIDFDQAWSPGDWLGYGDYHPMQMWSRLTDNGHPGLKGLLSDPSSHGVLGNHDLGILNSDVLKCGFNDRAWSVLKRQQAYIQSSRIWMTEFAPWLRGQSLLLSPAPGVYMAHGAFFLDNPCHIPCLYTPRDHSHEDSLTQINTWLKNGASPDRAEHLSIASENRRSPLILITGHTHQQRVWQRLAHSTKDGQWPDVAHSYPSINKIRHCIDNQVALEQVVRVTDLSAQRPVWINPGSVGEQRDSQEPRPGKDWEWAKYAVLEWDGPESDQAVVYLYWVPYQRQS